MASEGLPESGACWECFQPPLYYVLAAPLYHLAELGDPVLPVRLLSLAFYLGFLFFAIRLLALEIRPLAPYYAALALLVFWPYGVISSSMVSNDLPLYTMQAAALYTIVRWRREPSVRLLALAVLASGLASAFELNGLVVGGFVALTFLHESRRDRALLRRGPAPRRARRVPVAACPYRQPEPPLDLPRGDRDGGALRPCADLHRARGRRWLFACGMLLPLAFSGASALFFAVDSRL